MVSLYAVTTGWIVDISLCENSIKYKKSIPHGVNGQTFAFFAIFSTVDPLVDNYQYRKNMSIGKRKPRIRAFWPQNTILPSTI